MKTKSLLIFGLLAGGCFGQTANGQTSRTNSQIIDFILEYQEKQLLDVAEAMPAEKYEFVPARGVFQGVRSFAEQLKHVAADNYMLAAGILGEKTPGNVGPNESGSRSVCTKPQIIAYLRMNDIVPPGSHTAANEVAPADGSPSMSLALDFWISNTEKQVLLAADAMPEEKYSFAPTAGEFTGVRTFAQQVMHLSAEQLQNGRAHARAERNR